MTKILGDWTYISQPSSKTIYLKISGIIKRAKCYPSQQAIISSFQAKYKKCKWNVIAKWHHSNSLPIPIITRKDKDVTRIRAMVSYCHHPLKRILLLASPGLMTILKAIKFKHGNLCSPFEGQRPRIAKRAHDGLS